MSLHLPKHHWGTRGMAPMRSWSVSVQALTVVAIKKIRSLNEVQGVTTGDDDSRDQSAQMPKPPQHRGMKEVVVSSENDDDDAEFTDKDEPLDYCHGSIYLVLEYLEHDLTGLIDRQHPSTFVPDKPKPKRLREYLMRETTARKRILPKGALELIEALLVLDPEQRLTAGDCLKAQYFQARPYAPDDPKKLPPITNLPPSHEYQTKKIRREQAKQLNGGAANNSNSNTGAGGGRASRPNNAKDGAEVTVKTEIKREEDPSSSAKKRRRVA
ncbi:Protein kinase-like domain [Phytophthora cactorum]|nr:Protein kinase-like domain [Phytophthora cactorum]